MKTILAIIGILLSFQFSYAQETANSDIQIPSTPGMNIIGVQNSEITTPGNYTGLYTSLISPIVSNNGTIPTDLSLEFSPYYLESRNLTFNELNKTNIYRDLKISIASTNVIREDSTNFSRMGIGFKTNLLSGKYTAKSADKDKITLALANDVNTVVEKINSGLYGNVDTAKISLFIEHIKERNNDLKSEIESIFIEHRGDKSILIGKLEELKGQIEESIVVDDSRWNYSLRTGSFLEFAGALAIDFPENTFNSSEINRWAIWFNYTYRPKRKLGVFDFGSILRVSNHSFDPAVIFEEKALFGDVGGSLNLRVPNTKFTVSSEWIWKFGITDLKASDGENEYSFKSATENKWNVSIGYKITDNTIWSMSLSELNGNSDYLRDKSMQFLMGISASLVPLKD
nr:hypothetical protein [uncultured Draconibacterium sp.]